MGIGDLNLTLACEDYDRTRALQDGSVKPEGINLTYLVLSVEETFWRMLRYGTDAYLSIPLPPLNGRRT